MGSFWRAEREQNFPSARGWNKNLKVFEIANNALEIIRGICYTIEKNKCSG